MKTQTKRITGRKRRAAILDADVDTQDLGYEGRHALLTGGDVDADWQGAEASGDEAVGGSVATPDQDVVDELGRALGVEAGDGEELHMSNEILENRDRFRWHLERDAEDEAEGRHHRRRGVI